MTTFMPPPPASTFLAFHPQDNNIIAIGMEDSTIHIYNVRVDEVPSCIYTSLLYFTVLTVFHFSLNKIFFMYYLGEDKIERPPEAYYWSSFF